MTEQEYIEILRPMVTYDKPNRLHYMGSTILTNHEMKYMLSAVCSEWYDKLPSNEQRKARDRIFDELRDNSA